MNSTQHQPQSLRVEAYIREDFQGASDRIDAVLDRLERLNTEKIGSVSVTNWTNSSWPATTQAATSSLLHPQSAVRATVDEFTEWAAHQGYSLAPAFTQPSAENDGCLKVPIIGLALYDAEDDADTTDTQTNGDDDGDALLAVFPYTDQDGEVQTVEDCLAMLEETLKR